MFDHLHKLANSLPDEEQRIRLLTCVNENAEGKIFCENERARVVKQLSDIFEGRGDLKRASELLLSLHVETFGSMEKHEKNRFLVDQIRLALLTEDFTKAQLIGKKVNQKDILAFEVVEIVVTL